MSSTMAAETQVLSDEQRASYDQDGYLQLDSFVSAQWLAELRAASEEFVEQSRALTASNRVLDIEPDHTPDAPRLRRLISPLDHHDTFYRFTTEGPPALLAQELLGGPVRFHHSKLNYKWADGGEEVKWHQDIQFWPHTDFTPLTIGVYLEDVDDAMGPMGVLPGSHRGRLYDLYAEDGSWAGAMNDDDAGALDLDAMVWLKGPAGSVTVHNCCMVHGSLPNDSPRPRPLLLQTYSAVDSYPVAGIGANGVTGRNGGFVIGGPPSQMLSIHGRSMHGAPDWSKKGSTDDLRLTAERRRVSDGLRGRLESAWAGRISGCQLGKPVELLSMRHGPQALTDYLTQAEALPVRDYVPLVDGTIVARHWPQCCRGQFDRSEPDDDINYSVLALLLLERHGTAMTTADVARAWLDYLPGGMVFTAERAAYVTLLAKASYQFSGGADPGFDLAECNDNEFNDWIGAQIRADVYGWVCPARPELAADLARRDAELSHQDEGVYGAMAVAAIGACIPATTSLAAAVDAARGLIPSGSDCAAAIDMAVSEASAGHGPEAIQQRYADLSPVHTVNNLALVVWGLLAGEDDFGRAIGDTVAAGWDTDCNGATVGGLWGLSGRRIPPTWTEPWNGRVAVTLAGIGELTLGELVDRTVAVAEAIGVD